MADGEAGQIASTAARPARKAGQGRIAVRLGGEEAHPVTIDQKAPVRQQKRASKRGDDVRQRILAAALECFGAFGFEGTSTRAVADRAKVTHTLVLYHFRSKEQLWIATIGASLAAYTARMAAYIAQAGTGPADALRTFIEQFIRMSARQPQVHRILTMESNQNTTRLEWVIENFLREHFIMVRDLIRAGQEQGVVRQCDPARLYYMLISAGGTPFTVSTEYKALTGRDVFSETEILRNIAFLYELVFIEAP
ncbi:MAG: TetR family transcriptional regulator [Pseudomonadota bacterium]